MECETIPYIASSVTGLIMEISEKVNNETFLQPLLTQISNSSNQPPQTFTQRCKIWISTNLDFEDGEGEGGGEGEGVGYVI